MKLWYSATSPYVRKVRAVAAHHGLSGEIELEAVEGSSFAEQSGHNRDNPLGRVPALQTAQEGWLYSSNVIAEYLDAQGRNTTLYPQGKNRWAVLNLHELAAGLMDNTVAMLAEKLLRPQAEWWQGRHEQILRRNASTLPILAKSVNEFGTELNIGTINAVCAIDFLRFRHALTLAQEMNGFGELCEWADQMNTLYPCLSQTKPSV